MASVRFEPPAVPDCKMASQDSRNAYCLALQEQETRKVKAEQLAKDAERQRQIQEGEEWLAQQREISSSLESSFAAASGGSGSCGAGLLGEIAYMESSCNSTAQNASGATGLLQFMPGTFAGVCGTCCDIYSTECQLAAGQVMLDQGRQCEWEVLHC